jgi:hypothetical protein
MAPGGARLSSVDQMMAEARQKPARDFRRSRPSRGDQAKVLELVQETPDSVAFAIEVKVKRGLRAAL